MLLKQALSGGPCVSELYSATTRYRTRDRRPSVQGTRAKQDWSNIRNFTWPALSVENSPKVFQQQPTRSPTQSQSQQLETKLPNLNISHSVLYYFVLCVFSSWHFELRCQLWLIQKPDAFLLLHVQTSSHWRQWSSPRMGDVLWKEIPSAWA